MLLPPSSPSRFAAVLLCTFCNDLNLCASYHLQACKDRPCLPILILVPWPNSKAKSMQACPRGLHTLSAAKRASHTPALDSRLLFAADKDANGSLQLLLKGTLSVKLLTTGCRSKLKSFRACKLVLWLSSASGLSALPAAMTRFLLAWNAMQSLPTRLAC